MCSKAGVGRKVQVQNTGREDREEERNGQMRIPPACLPLGGAGERAHRGGHSGHSPLVSGAAGEIFSYFSRTPTFFFRF